MATVKNRYEFMLLLEAKNCNPNGDPDMGNLPRTDPDTEQAIITDVAIKRRIRNYVQEACQNKEIMMKSGTSINRKIAEAVLSVNEIEKFDDHFVNTKVEETEAWLAGKYWDVRAFGGVLSTGRNAGQVRGAVQIAMASSVDPITVEDMTITRMCYTDGKDFKTIQEYEDEESGRSDDKKRTMGNKKIASYALFVITGTISACLAEKNGFSEDDLAVLEEALLQMYNHDVSSSKTGMSVVSPLMMFKHVGTQSANNAEQNAREAKLGCASAYKLFKLLSVKKKTDVEYPRDYSDYEVTFDATNIPKGVMLEVKEDPFSPVLQGKDALDGLGRNDIMVK